MYRFIAGTFCAFEKLLESLPSVDWEIDVNKLFDGDRFVSKNLQNYEDEFLVSIFVNPKKVHYSYNFYYHIHN